MFEYFSGSQQYNASKYVTHMMGPHHLHATLIASTKTCVINITVIIIATFSTCHQHTTCNYCHLNETGTEFSSLEPRIFIEIAWYEQYLNKFDRECSIREFSSLNMSCLYVKTYVRCCS